MSNAEDAKREPVTHEAAGAAHLTAEAALRVEGTVERGLNEIRLAVLGILATIGLTVGFGLTQCQSWVRVLAGVGSFATACALIKWKISRKYLMAFVYWLTGQ